MPSVQLSWSRTMRILFSVLGVLLLLHFLMVFCHLVLHRRVEALTQLVDLDLEANLPTFFNVALFFIGAILFYMHGKTVTGSGRRGWYTMAGVFCFLGVDEGSQIHEKFMLVTLRLLNHGHQTQVDMGWFYYAWVLPYGIAGIALVLVLSRWLLNLDAALRLRLVISGIVYVFGAVFMEMFSGKIAESLDAATFTAQQLRSLPCEIYEPDTCHLYASMSYISAYTLEETCEMAGLILCIGTLLYAFEKKNASLRIVLVDASTPSDK